MLRLHIQNESDAALSARRPMHSEDAAEGSAQKEKSEIKSSNAQLAPWAWATGPMSEPVISGEVRIYGI